MLERENVVLNRQQSRMVDRVAIDRFGMHSLMLMENASRQCVDTLLEIGVNDPVVVCCGAGNNGGDGFVITRHLRIHGILTKVICVSPIEKLAGDALFNFKILQKTDCEIVELDLNVSAEAQRETFSAINGQAVGWVVDAMLGTGAKGAPRSPYREVIELISKLNRRVMAVDIPSGIDCDTGVIDGAGALAATINCTFVSKKPFHSDASVEPFFGIVKVLDIGVPDEVVREVLASDAINS